MPVDNCNGRFICDTDMIRLDPDQFPPFLMSIIDAEIPFSLPCLCKKPEVREFGSKRSWDLPYCGIRSQVWYNVEEGESDRDGVRREEKIHDGHFDVGSVDR